MRIARALLVTAGTAMAGYGGWLLWPQLPAAWTWLVAGPILHDAVLAPLAGLTGLVLGRLIPRHARRAWVIGGLAVSGVLLLVATPLLWRPRPAPLNPGLHDRDYAVGLLVALAVVWTTALLGAAYPMIKTSFKKLSLRERRLDHDGGQRAGLGSGGPPQRGPGRR